MSQPPLRWPSVVLTANREGMSFESPVLYRHFEHKSPYRATIGKRSTDSVATFRLANLAFLRRSSDIDT